MNYLGIDYSVKNMPALDPRFIPFGVWAKAYLQEADRPFKIAVERDHGKITVYETRLRGKAFAAANIRFAERLVKMLLWSVGGFRNAMPGIHHRKPGPIGAGSERENVVAELICDGQHIHPSAVRMAFKLFPGRICLISDALRCCGMPDGQYTLGGQDVFLYGGVAKLADGTLAGSATNLYDCMRKAVEFGIPKEQAILSATLIPAREIGREKKIGSIESGKLADFVVCDEELSLARVFMGGKQICE